MSPSSLFKENAISGRSSVWLERYLGVVEAARSSRVAPTKKGPVVKSED